MRYGMRLNQVTIPSTDVARAVEFYKALGLIQIVDSVPRYVRFVCPNGDSTLSIHRVAVISQGEKPVVYFECDDLDATVERLERSGIAFEAKPVDQSWLWREAYLRDPDGHRVCLYYAAENRLIPRWKVGWGLGVGVWRLGVGRWGLRVGPDPDLAPLP